MSDLRDTLQTSLGSNYALERELGGGGMSRVFVAEEVSLGRKVAVKVLPPDLAASVNVERFRREIQLAARLQHPHIVPLLAAGISDGLPYYTMPFVEGESLRARLARTGALPVGEATRILCDVLSALSYAHAHGVVHRDIKPDNILLTGNHAVVADFGVAKALSDSTNAGSALTSVGVALGTSAYMAPEQAAADPATDYRADIYAVGAMAYEMLTGRQVFSARSPHAMLAAHATEKPEAIDKRRPAVPAELSAVVMRALEKNPADRPQSADGMRAALEATVAPSGATASHGTGKEASRKSSRFTSSMPTAAAAAALLLTIASSTAYWYMHRSGDAGSGTDMRPGGAATSAISTVAVLPFANTDGNPQDEYFSDGMTDELARALSRVPSLRIASRTSSYAFKGKAVPAQEIGRTLNVAGLLEGTVRRSGNRLRVTAQLTDAKSGLVVWTDGFERPAADVFQVQDDLTKAIVTELTPALSGSQAASVAAESRGTTDPQAYDLYLRGRFEWNKRDINSVLEGIRDFNAAIARDSSFARAYAALASSYVLLPQEGGHDKYPIEQMLVRVRADASRAIARDSSLAEPHAALALALLNNWDWASAQQEFLRAIALGPNYPTAHQWYALWLQAVGQSEEALAEIQRARALDPLSQIIADNLCEHSARAGKPQVGAQACKEARKANLLDGNAIAEMLRGQFDSAAADWKRVQIIRSANGLAAYSLARAGHRAEAVAMLKDFEQRGREPLNVSLAYLGLGDKDNALKWLDRAVDRHEDSLTDFATPVSGMVLAPLRGEPRFQRIIDRMGLTEYAMKAG